MKAKTLFPLFYILILLTSCTVGQMQDKAKTQDEGQIQDEAQNYIYLIKKNNVKSRIENKERVFEYSYSGSTIIETLSQNDDQIVKRFYMNERSQIDSIIPEIENGNSSFSFNEYYSYNTKNQLIKKVNIPSSSSDSLTEEFIYSRSGNLDTIFYITISKDFDSEKIDRDTKFIHFIYDDKNRLILKKSNLQASFEEAHYHYDSKGRLKSETLDFGYSYKGPTDPKDRLVFEYVNYYYPSGYREKQIETVYGIKPDGTKIKTAIQTSYYHKNGLLEKSERENFTRYFNNKNLIDEYEYTFYEN